MTDPHQHVGNPDAHLLLSFEIDIYTADHGGLKRKGFRCPFLLMVEYVGYRMFDLFMKETRRREPGDPRNGMEISPRWFWNRIMQLSLLPITNGPVAH